MNYKEILGKINDVNSQKEIANALIKDSTETLNLFCNEPCSRCKTDLNGISEYISWSDNKFWVEYVLAKLYVKHCKCANPVVWKDQNINRAFENAMYVVYEHENNLKKENIGISEPFLIHEYEFKTPDYKRFIPNPNIIISPWGSSTIDIPKFTIGGTTY